MKDKFYINKYLAGQNLKKSFLFKNNLRKKFFIQLTMKNGVEKTKYYQGKN